MDPNVTVARMLQLCRSIDRIGRELETDDKDEIARLSAIAVADGEELAYLTVELFRWLENGGAAPVWSSK